MIRPLIALLFFLLLFVLQTSFIHALPSWLGIIPLFFGVSVYFTQHHSLALGAIWLALFGVFLDIFHLGNIPLETISYTLAGLTALILSRRVFSNRSLYGVLACGTASYAVLFGVHTIVLFFVYLQIPERVVWQPFFIESATAFIELFILLLLLFQFAGSFRAILIRSFLLSSKHETF